MTLKVFPGEKPGGSLKPICAGCQKHPDQIWEYRDAAAHDYRKITPDEYVRLEEGTFNPDTGRFLCSECYVAAGMPTLPGGWRA